MRLLFICYFLIFATACFSTPDESGYVVDEKGNVKSKYYVSGNVIMPFRGYSLEHSLKSKELLKLLPQQTTLLDSIKILSKLGIQYVSLGQYNLAIKLYREIEKESPNLYNTASNIGTTYELMGQIDSALYWIKRSEKLNDKPYETHEWIHIKILEHKLSGQPLNGSFLDLDEQEDKNMYNIQTQLQKRTILITSKDLYTAQLFFDYGNILSQKISITVGLEAFKFARAYGLNSPEFNRKEKELKKILASSKQHEIKWEMTKKFFAGNKYAAENKINRILTKSDSLELMKEAVFMSHEDIENLFYKPTPNVEIKEEEKSKNGLFYWLLGGFGIISLELLYRSYSKKKRC